MEVEEFAPQSASGVSGGAFRVVLLLCVKPADWELFFWVLGAEVNVSGCRSAPLGSPGASSWENNPPSSLEAG